MDDNQNSNSSTKKTLGIKTGTLGLSNRSKLSISNIVNKSSSQYPINNKGTVVVVNKIRHNAKSDTMTKMSSRDGLTDKEREDRLMAVKQAEAYKKVQQEKERERLLELEKEELRLREIKDAELKLKKDKADDAEDLIHHSNTVDESEEDIKLRNDKIKTLITSKGKIRNLNTVGESRKVIDKESTPKEVEQSIVIDTNDLDETKKLKSVVKKPRDNAEEDEKIIFDVKKQENDKKSNRKLSVNQVMMMDQEEGGFRKVRSLASLKRAREKAKRQHGYSTERDKIFKEVSLSDIISVQELANRMAEKASDVLKVLMKLGVIVTINQSIDADTAELVITEFGHKLKRITAQDVEKSLLSEIEDSVESLQSRPPVVTIMGHVDHGKTSLLDALRATDVAAYEAGGITQHIGAYQVKLESGEYITFLDTPGHEAFTAMRLRGAQVTDIVVLVVAADDGIMEQTIEAINHAKAANVPIIVAVNKIDKPDADIDRIKNELLMHNLVPEDMGGDTIVIGVSAKKKINLDKLEEAILLQADLLELSANPNRFAKGIVIEAQIDKGRGVVATLLVHKGTLKVGDIVVAGTSYGKIRTLNDYNRQKVISATPSVPVEVVGLNDAPTAGDEFVVTANEKTAKDIVEFRVNQQKEKVIINSRKTTLEQMFIRSKDNKFKEFNIIIRADVQGSLEAICNSVTKISSEEISMNILHNGIGGITESDVTLATASKAIIIGFNVRANNQAKDLAKKNGVDIRYYSIIYNLVDEIKAAMSGLLSPNIKEQIMGYIDVKQVFDLTRFGKVAGSYVTDGLVKRNANARLIRDNVVIYNGKLKALKRFKEDVKEVKAGFECGVSFENYEDIKPNDRIEVYELISEERKL